jgi:hypothetical protein
MFKIFYLIVHLLNVTENALMAGRFLLAVIGTGQACHGLRSSNSLQNKTTCSLWQSVDVD